MIMIKYDNEEEETKTKKKQHSRDKLNTWLYIPIALVLTCTPKLQQSQTSVICLLGSHVTAISIHRLRLPSVINVLNPFSYSPSV